MLPISLRVTSKVLSSIQVTCFLVNSDSSPATPLPSLHSTCTVLLVVLQTNLAFTCLRAFAPAVPYVWDILLPDVYLASQFLCV